MQPLELSGICQGLLLYIYSLQFWSMLGHHICKRIYLALSQYTEMCCKVSLFLPLKCYRNTKLANSTMLLRPTNTITMLIIQNRIDIPDTYLTQLHLPAGSLIEVSAASHSSNAVWCIHIT